jgi:hypothetical protein
MRRIVALMGDATVLARAITAGHRQAPERRAPAAVASHSPEAEVRRRIADLGVGR